MRLINRNSKQHNGASKEGSANKVNNLDGIYALLRRMQDRLTNVEAKLSVCQRDVWRIEKQNQTLKLRSEPLPASKNGEVETLPPWFYSMTIGGQ